MQLANIFIPNKDVRNQFQNELWNTGYSLLNSFALVACKNAYSKCEDWLIQCKAYIEGNIKYMIDYFSRYLPKIKVVKPQGTYTPWLDFRELGLNEETINDKLTNVAKVWLSSGSLYGECGTGFYRINVALPRKQLKLALDRIYSAFK